VNRKREENGEAALLKQTVVGGGRPIRQGVWVRVPSGALGHAITRTSRNSRILELNRPARAIGVN